MRNITESFRRRCTHPEELINSLVSRCFLWLPDKLYLQVKYRLMMGSWPDFNSPKTFSEKIQWLKLHDRNPLHTTMVDKYAVKQYVSDLIGDEYVIPTLGVWDRPEDIDFGLLPNQFVLKTTHGGGSGGVVICKDKEKFDTASAINKLKKAMSADIYSQLREWPYKNVPRRIIAEEYLNPAPNVSDLTDYKWYCFNGEPRFCQVIQDRSSHETIDFFDTEWNHQEFVGLNPSADHADVLPSRPKNLDTQLAIARTLSKDMPFCRIDLYEIEEKQYFGEITLFPASGMGRFRPEEYNALLGEMLVLPGERVGGVFVEVNNDGSIQFSKPDLHDYKLFCFNGKVKYFKIDFDRQTDHHANYFDRAGNLMPFGEADLPPVPSKHLRVPESLPLMITLAEIIAKGETFVRIDFYNHFNQIRFGEITFFPASGLGRFTLSEYDEILGKELSLQ